MLKKVDFENSSLQNEQTTSTDNIKFGDSIFKNPNNTAVSKPVSHNFFNPFKNNFDNDIELKKDDIYISEIVAMLSE